MPARFQTPGLLLAFLVLLALVLGSSAEGLVWEPLVNRVRSDHGLTNIIVRFSYTNDSKGPVEVLAVKPSCHCTTPKIPSLPWTIPSGTAGILDVEVELAGKWGEISKTIVFETATATNTLQLIVEIPEPDPREKNRLAAFVDRQAVFKGDCASCHLAPGIGKSGEPLFKAVCSICHEAEHRGPMVPDLAAKPHGEDAYWLAWLRIGKPGTFMPAFDKPHGGPLTEEQIASLVKFLSVRFPASPGARAKMPLE